MVMDANINQNNQDNNYSPREESWKTELRINFYNFLTRLEYLQAVFNNVEKYRLEREVELLKHVKENSYADFIEKFGKEQFHETATVVLWFQHTIIHSLFVSSFSEFEVELNRVAVVLQKHIPSRIKIKDFVNKKNDIDNLRKYLDLVHNIQNANSQKPSWTEIDNFREIRNRIVHHLDKIPDDSEKAKKKKVTDFLLKNKIHIDNDSRFQISISKFLMDFLDIVKDYLGDIVQEIAPVPPSTA